MDGWMDGWMDRVINSMHIFISESKLWDDIDRFQIPITNYPSEPSPYIEDGQGDGVNLCPPPKHSFPKCQSL